MLPSGGRVGKRHSTPCESSEAVHARVAPAACRPERRAFDSRHNICYHDAPEGPLSGREADRKGCHVPVLTVQIGQAALVGNQRRASSPWAHSFQDTSSDVDMGSLYLNLEGVSSETAGTIANEVARHYFENTSVTPETALLRSVRHAYRFLYDARLEDSLANIGLTALVMCNGRASIAQVLPTQFYLVQEGELTALPETQERLTGLSARPAQEGRYPQWEPPIEMFRATLYPQDVAVLCSDNIGAALSDDEVEDALSDGKIQTVAESLVDTARKRGERDASVMALQFVNAEETLQTAETVSGETAADSGSAAGAARPRSEGNVVTSHTGDRVGPGNHGWVFGCVSVSLALADH